jgi:uncharacterized protein (TIGR02466 family)
MPFSDTSVKNLFATPLIVASMPQEEGDDLNLQIREIVLNQCLQNAGVKISNHGGWQSDDRIIEWGGAPVTKLLDAITDVLAQITLRQENGQIERVSVEWRVNGWANINHKGDANVIHCHPGAFWSAVYYVQVEEEGSTPTGGNLELFDPRGIMPIMYCPVLRMGIKGYVSAGTSELHKPKTGQMVIFPSWLSHAVTPYSGDGARISLAFNFSV